jgi:hypothetical protein
MKTLQTDRDGEFAAPKTPGRRNSAKPDQQKRVVQVLRVFQPLQEVMISEQLAKAVKAAP